MNGNNYFNFELPDHLSTEEFNILFLKYKNGDEKAGDEIILHNLKLVIKLLYKYYPSLWNKSEDYIPFGIIGLINALKTFDNSKDIKFSTYAGTCIINGIKIALRDNHNNIRTISLNNPIGENDDGFSLENILTDDHDMEEEYIVEEEKIFVDSLINLLPERDRVIMKSFFRFNDKESVPVNKLSQKYNISRAGINYIVKKNLAIFSRIIKNNIIPNKNVLKKSYKFDKKKNR